MTVPSQSPVSNHVGNGVTTTFPYEFKLLNQADIVVSVNGVVKTINVDYTVTGVEVEAGGSIIFSVAPAALAAIALVRKVAINRLTDYQYAGDFESDTVNKDFDRLVMMVQDNDLVLESTIRFPEGDSESGVLPGAADRAFKGLAFDADGKPFLTTAAGDANALAAQLASVAAPTYGGGQVGYDAALAYAAGTAGKGIKDAATSAATAVSNAAAAQSTANSATTNINTFKTDVASLTDVAKGAALMGYKRNAAGSVGRSVLDKLSDLPSVKDFGAVGDGVTNDAPAIQAAIDAVSGALYIPPGNYRLNAGLIWTKSNVQLLGAGQGSTTLTSTFSTGDIISVGDGTANPNNTLVAGFSMTSTVARSAGAAVRVRNGHNVTVEQIRLDSNMYWGFRFDGGAQQFIYRLNEFEINSGAIGVLVGESGGVVQDMFINNGIIYGMSEAGILLKDASGVYSNQVDCVACGDGLTTYPGASQTVRYCFFTQGVMDTCNNNGWNFTSNGGIVAEVNLDNCWGASCGVTTNGHGMFIGTASGATRAFAVSNSRFINNRGSGIRLGNSLKVTFANCQCIANSTQGSGISHGMQVDAGVQFWNVVGGVFGDNGAFGTSNNQAYGIFIAAGASDNYTISNAIVAQNVTGGISDGGSGSNKRIAGCVGFKTSAAGVGQVAVGTNTVTVNHGLASAPATHEVALTFLTNAGASGIASCHVASVSATQIVINTNASAVTNPLFIGWQARVKGV